MNRHNGCGCSFVMLGCKCFARCAPLKGPDNVEGSCDFQVCSWENSGARSFTRACSTKIEGSDDGLFLGKEISSGG